MSEPRYVRLRLRLAGGQEHEVRLREDSPELLAIFAALASGELSSEFFQLPLEEGRVACSFRASQLISVVSEPPVVLQGSPMSLPEPVESASRTAPAAWSRLRRARHLVVDDFLCPDEHRDLLAMAIASENLFEAGTVTNFDPEYRQNLNIPGFGQTAHAKLLQNRLLVWFPLLAKRLGEPVFPLASVESQLTAAGSAQFFKLHADSAPDNSRAISCVYYIHREPRAFSGGELRLYDCLEEEGGSCRAAHSFETVEPVSNRLVVFPSNEFHEVMPVRCPSDQFADYRFAVTSWLHRREQPDSEATFGWGHFRCGAVAPQFASLGFGRGD